MSIVDTQAEAGWGTPGAVNVKQAPYNASGDGRTDDTQALQRAIDEHDVVLLPKGTYCVSRTLKLRENTLLVGLRHMSTIAACPTAGGDFADPGDPRPILQSPDSGEWGNRPHMLIRNASDVTIYGLKEEGPRSIA